MTWTRPRWTTYCTLQRPRTPSASAIRVVASTIWARTSGSNPAGYTAIESPLWTPARSTCSMIPGMTTLSPSQMASTSASVPSRYLSTSTSAAPVAVLGARRHRGDEIALERGAAVDDLHRPAAEHVRRAHQDREADPLGDPDRLRGVDGRRALGLGDAEGAEQRLEAVAVLGGVDGVEPLPSRSTPARRERRGEVDRGLPAELRHRPAGALGLDDVGDRLLVERLEVEAGAAVEVGRDRLRVAVDHHRLDPAAAQRERRLDAAVVELDALADPDRPRAEHHHRAAARQSRGRAADSPPRKVE